MKNDNKNIVTLSKITSINCFEEEITKIDEETRIILSKDYRPCDGNCSFNEFYEYKTEIQDTITGVGENCIAITRRIYRQYGG